MSLQQPSPPRLDKEVREFYAAKTRGLNVVTWFFGLNIALMVLVLLIVLVGIACFVGFCLLMFYSTTLTLPSG